MYSNVLHLYIRVCVCVCVCVFVCVCVCIFSGGSVGKESSCNVGDLGSIPGLRRSSGEGKSNPFEYSCLENPMGREAWWGIVHEVIKSWTQFSDQTSTTYIYICIHTHTHTHILFHILFHCGLLQDSLCSTVESCCFLSLYIYTYIYSSLCLLIPNS